MKSLRLEKPWRGQAAVTLALGCTLLLAAVSGSRADALSMPGPPPMAAHRLSSWREAFDWLRARLPEYHAGRDAILRAEAETRVALSALLPRARAHAAFAHQLVTTRDLIGERPVTIPAQDAWSVAGELIVPVGDLADLHAWGSAKLGVRAAEREFAERRRELARRVVTTLLAASLNERVAALSRLQLGAALERLELTRARVRLGAGTDLDTDRAHQDALTARAAVVEADEALRRAHDALGLALGSAEPTAAPEDVGADGVERAVARICEPDSRIEQRADVAAARTRMELARRALRETALRYLPRFGLESRFAWQSRVVYGPRAAWDLRGVVSVPIWDGGERYGQQAKLEAAYDEAQRNLESVRLNALVEARRERRGVEVSAALLELAREQHRVAVRADERARMGYERGAGTSLELVSSAQARRAAELDLTLRESQWVQARAHALLSVAHCSY